MLIKLRQLLQMEWWRSMFGVLLRTFLAGVAPLMLAYSAGTTIPWRDAVSQVVLLLVVAVLTSLAGVPVPGAAPYWEILLARFLRQFAQYILAGIGTALLFSDVPWTVLLAGGVASAVSTVLVNALVVVPSVATVPVEPVVVAQHAIPEDLAVPATGA